MNTVAKHTIGQVDSISTALKKLDALGADAILFLVNQENKLVGSLTDGDLRRGFIKGLNFETPLLEFIQAHPSFIYEKENAIEQIEEFKKRNLKIIPILNRQHQIVDILNLRIQKTLIPADAVLMAGGEGKRLRPLTQNTPKPLLKVGDKPIIEYNIDSLSQYGIRNLYLSINYLGEQIENYFGNGQDRNLNIKYIKESKPLGTVGSILLADGFEHSDILIMNSDLLTDIDYADFYKQFIQSKADMAVATIEYKVDIPYAVLETDADQCIRSLKEKPRYTYYANAGIYFIKKELLELIPSNTFYDITDLMNQIMELKKKIVMFPINGYWLDIGKHEDFKKAQEDIKHLKL